MSASTSNCHSSSICSGSCQEKVISCLNTYSLRLEHRLYCVPSSALSPGAFYIRMTSLVREKRVCGCSEGLHVFWSDIKRVLQVCPSLILNINRLSQSSVLLAIKDNIPPSSLSPLDLFRSAAGAVTLPSHLFPGHSKRHHRGTCNMFPEHSGTHTRTSAVFQHLPHAEISHQGGSGSLSANALVNMENKALKASSTKVWLWFIPH